jgi:hypothetical protein
MLLCIVQVLPGYGVHDRRVAARFSVAVRISFYLCLLDLFRGPRSLLSNGYQWAISPGIKRSDSEFHHSSPYDCEVKNAWTYVFIAFPYTPLWHIARN